MQIKEIIKDAALMVGRIDVCDYINNNKTELNDTYETINTMVNLSNLVINELACTYIPLIRKEEISLVYGRQNYDIFSRKVVKIIAIYDSYGQKIDFEEELEGIYVKSKKSVVETIKVEYEYLPNHLALDDDAGYIEKNVSAREIACGVAAEYCISQGLFEQAVMHHKRYIDALSQKVVVKNSKIKDRSWC